MIPSDLQKKKKALLNQMKIDILGTEKKIKNNKYENLKIKNVKNLKITGKILKFTLPYILTTGMAFETFALFGVTPFIIDKREKRLQIMKELDNYGNIRYEEQYDSFEENKSRVIYYSKWEQTENGFFTRNIEYYYLPKVKRENTEEFLNKKVPPLKVLLGMPYLVKTETKNNVSEEELKKGEIVKALIYFESENNPLVTEESVTENTSWSLLWFLLIVVLNSGTAKVMTCLKYYNDFFNDFDLDGLHDAIVNIKHDHEPIDVNCLKKQLKIRKENYDRLMGD